MDFIKSIRSRSKYADDETDILPQNGSTLNINQSDSISILNNQSVDLTNASSSVFHDLRKNQESGKFVVTILIRIKI
jgi:fibrillarin-like rRNA methylase